VKYSGRDLLLGGLFLALALVLPLFFPCSWAGKRFLADVLSDHYRWVFGGFSCCRGRGIYLPFDIFPLMLGVRSCFLLFAFTYTNAIYIFTMSLGALKGRGNLLR